jgi:hypothetical protein
MSYGVLIPNAIMATNIDSLNRTVVDAVAIENGQVLVMGARSTTAGLSEVFEISQPASSGSNLTGLWMAYSGDEIVLTDARYKGIDPDVRNFINAAAKPFSAYKPMLGDIITLTDDAITGTYSAGVTTHINATNADWQLNWGNSQTASVLSYKLLGVKYISLATGAIDTQRVVAYEFECVGL